MRCFQRFQRSLNTKLILSRWSRGEDAKLKAEVAKYGERNWQQVASKMKMRTDQQWSDTHTHTHAHIHARTHAHTHARTRAHTDSHTHTRA